MSLAARFLYDKGDIVSFLSSDNTNRIGIVTEKFKDAENGQKIYRVNYMRGDDVFTKDITHEDDSMRLVDPVAYSIVVKPTNIKALLVDTQDPTIFTVEIKDQLQQYLNDIQAAIVSKKRNGGSRKTKRRKSKRRKSKRRKTNRNRRH